MPLKSGEENVSDNIRELHGGKVHARTARKFGKNRADKQSIAIAMSKAREESLAANALLEAPSRPVIVKIHGPMADVVVREARKNDSVFFTDGATGKGPWLPTEVEEYVIDNTPDEIDPEAWDASIVNAKEDFFSTSNEHAVVLEVKPRSLIREDDERREIGIAREIIQAVSDSNSLPETRFAEIRQLANELWLMHRGVEADLSAPRSDWRDDTPHALGFGHP